MRARDLTVGRCRRRAAPEDREAMPRSRRAGREASRRASAVGLPCESSAAAADEAAGTPRGRQVLGAEPHLHLGAAEDAAVDAQVAARGLGGAAGDVQAEAGGAPAA